jgi:hypothetical protein
MLLAAGSCKKQTAGKGRIYTPAMANCNGFSASDAAAILGIPASKVTAKTEELYAGDWQCMFTTDEAGKIVFFNVSVAKSAEDASRQMAQYRSHLKTVGEVSPFKENLPKGAYSDIGGLGDDGVWTDINLSLAIRQGNVTVHVLMPKDKALQTKIAEKFLATLK